VEEIRDLAADRGQVQGNAALVTGESARRAVRDPVGTAAVVEMTEMIARRAQEAMTARNLILDRRTVIEAQVRIKNG